MADLIAEANAKIAEQQKLVAEHAKAQTYLEELGHLQKMLQNLPPDAQIVVRITSAQKGLVRDFVIANESAASLLEIAHKETARVTHV